MADLMFACRFCQTRVSTGEETVGMEGACPTCNQILMIPPAAGQIVCPSCRKTIKYTVDLIGATFKCPGCRNPVTAPLGAAAAPPVMGRAPAVGGAPPPPPGPAPKPAAPAKRGPLLGGLFSKVGWCLVDCVGNEARVVDRFPFDIGSDEAVDWRLDGIQPNHCTLMSSKDLGVSLLKNEDTAPLTVNGYDANESGLLTPDTDYAITIGPHCFLLRGSKGVEEWLRQVDTRRWYVTDAGTRHGPMKLAEVEGFVSQRSLNPDNVTAMPEGVAVGFSVAQLAGALGLAREKAGDKTPHDEGPPIEITERRGPGSLTCPVCWLNFNLGDVMHIAMHESLRGDPVLGEDAMLRFHATKFNDQGQALDALSLPCLDLACPHCHRKLPPGFIETPHHIVSLVGAPSAGKSYYLSVLMKMLPREVFSQFGVVFKDADPTGNAALNVMKSRLFTGASPEQVYLDKTRLEGEMYEKILRQGRVVSLPKPFIFSINAAQDTSQRCAIIFYDNAGEHFQPDVDDLRSPGAQHVATASMLLFLFDPTANVEFRQVLSGHPDPQLQVKQHLDQQDIILSEMQVRIHRLLRLSGGERVQRPMAVLVGKCDVWLPLLGKRKLAATIRDKKLDLDAIAGNSAIVRGLLQRVCPEIVANAEAIATDVVYFPVSSFGHSPTKLPDGRIAPDPKQLRPIGVETPMIWALSRIVPGLIPTTSNETPT